MDTATSSTRASQRSIADGPDSIWSAGPHFRCPSRSIHPQRRLRHFPSRGQDFRQSLPECALSSILSHVPLLRTTLVIRKALADPGLGDDRRPPLSHPGLGKENVLQSPKRPTREYRVARLRPAALERANVPNIAADIVDAYIFRRINARTQFLLLQRRLDLPLGGTWQSIHAKVDGSETALDAALRAVRACTNLDVLEIFSADYVNRFYDHASDTIILAPVFALTVPPRARPMLSTDYQDAVWCDREEAQARLLWTGQRNAIRQIDEVIGIAGEEAEYYRIR